MESIETVRARHAAELVKLEREHAIAELCSITPRAVQLTSHGLATWLHYRTASLVDALDLVARLGDLVPFYQYKGTFSRFQPEALADAKSGEQVAGPFALGIDTSQGKGFGPNATLLAFIMVDGEIMNARIEIKAAHSFGATPVYRNERAAYRDDAVILSWNQNNRLAASSDKLIKWGSGSNDSCHFSYYWMADDVEGGHGHAAAMLWSLAEEDRRRSLNPMAESFLSIMLEDLQISENEEAFSAGREARDCGTIWTAPESTFRFVVDTCRAFCSSFWKDEAATVAIGLNEDRAGADLYLEMAGHGAGFRDRDIWDQDRDESAKIAERLSAAVDGRSSLETYIGDDGRAWISGAEKHGERF